MKIAFKKNIWSLIFGIQSEKKQDTSSQLIFNRKTKQ